MESIQQLVDGIRSNVFARQTSETLEDAGVDDLDTQSKVRGKGREFGASLIEIGDELGWEGNKNAATNASKAVLRAMRKFTRNYIFMTIYDCAIKVGFDDDEAVEFAAQSYMLSVANGDCDDEILRGWLNG